MELARCVEKSNAELTSTKEAYESQFAAMENGIQESALESAQNAIKLKDTETKLTYALEESQSTLKQFEEAHASITVLNEQLKTMEKKTQDLQVR